MAEVSRDDLMKALRNADAAGASDDARRLAAMIAKMDATQKRPPPSASMGSYGGGSGPKTSMPPSRDVQMAARGAYPVAAGALAGGTIGSLAGPPGIAAGAALGSVAVPAADLVASGYNALAPEQYEIGMPSAAVQEALTKYLRLPEPESTRDRVLEAAGAATAGGVTQVPAAAGMAATAASPVVRGVAAQLAAAPKAQIATAPISGGVGQAVTEATGSPLAGVVASGATGAGTGAASSARMRSATPAALARQELRDAAQAAYREAAQAGVVVNQQPFAQFVGGLRVTMGREGFDNGLHPQVSRVLDRLDEEATRNTISLEELEIARRVANSAVRQATRAGDDDALRLANRVVDEIDGFVDDLSPQQLAAGDADVAVPALNRARDLWRRNAQMRTIEDIVDISDDLGKPEYIKQRFQALIKNRSRFNQFTAEQQNVIRRIARTGILDGIGMLAPTYDASLVLKAPLYAAAGFGLNPVAGVAVPAVGMASRGLARMSRRGDVDELNTLISRGHPDAGLLDRLYFRAPGRTSAQVGATAAGREAIYGDTERARRRVLGN